MRDYGKVHTSFWESSTLREADDDGKLLALYLLTSAHTHQAGVFRLPMAYAVHDLGWTAERLANGFRTLSAINWLRRCERTGWVWIIKFGKFNKPDNPNQQKAVKKQIDLIPEECSFVGEMSTLEPLDNGFGNPPIPTPVPVPVLTTVTLDDGSEHPVTEDDLREFRSAYPLIDPLAEARKARAWCLANPGKRKTRRGVAKFLNTWMGNAQKDAEKNAPAKTLAAQPGGGRRAL